ncbi:MAG: NUDIX domain-containing protein [Acidimicrobiales bacterium]
MNDGDTRIHLTLTFDENVVGDLATYRRRFDPTMAAGVDPHVTLVYPEEYTDLELLMARARSAAVGVSPFTLSAARFVTDGDDGQNGVFAEFGVPSDSWNRLRHELLAPPFAPTETRPHLTIVHPRTSNLGPYAWTELGSRPARCHLVANELALTATIASNQRTTLERLPFTGTTRAVCVGVLLIADGRVLLGHRHPDRQWYPNTWDVIGGHVEPGESPVDTACREAAEELDIDVVAEDLTHLDTLVAHDVELVLFTTGRWQGNPTNNAPGEHTSIRWFERADLAGLDLADPALRNPAIAAVETRA